MSMLVGWGYKNRKLEMEGLNLSWILISILAIIGSKKVMVNRLGLPKIDRRSRLCR